MKLAEQLSTLLFAKFLSIYSVADLLGFLIFRPSTSQRGYKINNHKQFYYFIHNIHYQANDDYVPKSALPILSHVKDHNLGLYNSHKIKIEHVGYNTFEFSSKEEIDKLSLVIYSYNKEKLHVYLNDKRINNYAS